MAYWQSTARTFGKMISPKFYASQWAALEGKTACQLWSNVKKTADAKATEIYLVYAGAPGRDSVRRPYMMQSFLACCFLPVFFIWLTSRLFFRDPRLRKAAQITASAYGQGGQNVAAVPK
eukprot:GDKH01001870.1.p1 GENE.GDKH01001870.1~~GDKH01001870.1.p1  ORF type:complete len:120 (+),score=18.23 GDKH01001870.1:37-396(+)